ARARGRDVRHRARRRHAHPQDGRDGESDAGHHRHGAGPGGLHQVTARRVADSAVIPAQAGIQSTSGIQSTAGIPSPRAPADLARSLETRFLSKLEYLNAIGIALSQERDTNKLLETILIAAKNL